MSATTDRVRELVLPLVQELGADVYDVEHAGGVLRISLLRPEGLDMGLITEATRRISAELDRVDPLPGAYTLEVSSPGLERNLRTVDHFRGAVGELVKIKTRPQTEGDRRIEGELVAVDEAAATVRVSDGTERQVPFDDIERARTHLDWTPPPKPGAPRGGSRQKKSGRDKPARKSEAS